MKLKDYIAAFSILVILFAFSYAEAFSSKICKIPEVSTEHLVIYYAVKHKLPVNIFMAILKQESGLRINAVNRNSSDYGIGQINIKNIRRLKLDKARLLNDRHYSIEQAALFLAGLKRSYSAKEATWWTRYHSFTPSRRLIYLTQVSKHLSAKERNLLLAAR